MFIKKRGGVECLLVSIGYIQGIGYRLKGKGYRVIHHRVKV